MGAQIMETTLVKQVEGLGPVMMEMGMAGEPGELPRNRQKAVIGDLDQKPLVCCWDGDHVQH